MGKWKYSFTILDLGSRWIVQLNVPAALPPWKEPRCPLDRTLREPQSQSGRCGVEKNLVPLPGIEQRPSS
jgi:hypothetical protein